MPSWFRIRILNPFTDPLASLNPDPVRIRNTGRRGKVETCTSRDRSIEAYSQELGRSDRNRKKQGGHKGNMSGQELGMSDRASRNRKKQGGHRQKLGWLCRSKQE